MIGAVASPAIAAVAAAVVAAGAVVAPVAVVATGAVVAAGPVVAVLPEQPARTTAARRIRARFIYSISRCALVMM